MDADDRCHDDAVRILAELASDSVELATHDHVIGETLALLGARLGRRVVERFIDDVLPLVEVAGLAGQRFEAAVSAYRMGDFGDVSFVDVASFLLMRELGITKVFAFDSDFRHAGFEILA